MNTCLYANEIDDYACMVYRRHWPDGTLHQEDIRRVTGEDVCRRGRPDVICGGFPCQDLSVAGKRVGLGGERSGLWFEMLRLVREVRPRYVVVENVPGLLIRGMGRVLADLAESGFDAQWQVLPACAFGAPHIRERVFVVAYTRCGRRIPEQVFFSPTGKGLERQTQAYKESAWRGAHKRGCSGRVWYVPDGWPDGVDNGIPCELDRLKCLGNAIVPQVAQFVGEAVMLHNGGEFTFAELFAGIGGFRLGFERSGANRREEEL